MGQASAEGTTDLRAIATGGYVLVPEWATRLASVIFSGTSVSLTLLYGLHLGRAWYYGIPTSLISLSASTVVTMLLPGLFVLFAALATVLPLLASVVSAYGEISAAIDGEARPREPGWFGSRVQLVVGGLLAVVLCVMLWGVVYSYQRVFAATSSPVHKIALTLAIVDLVVVALGFAKPAPIRRLKALYYLCDVSAALFRIIAPAALALVCFAYLRTSPIGMALVVVVPVSIVVAWTRSVTDRTTFVVSSYADSLLHGEGRRWWSQSRLCLILFACVLSMALCASIIVGLNTASSSTSYEILPVSSSMRDGLPDGLGVDCEYLCVLDWYDSDRAVAVPAKEGAGGFTATLDDGVFCISDPELLTRRSNCLIEGAPGRNNALVLLRPPA